MYLDLLADSFLHIMTLLAFLVPLNCLLPLANLTQFCTFGDHPRTS